ncbi:GNAT family N-acetyltransferase [Spongiimicrobium sp. 3-5]|uniref:GNAT family N-acetyltransferase n=1 Tax=Spongiimicrobium sp. 3-5 TaxID=3332596 RepID=UPI00397F6B1D
MKDYIITHTEKQDLKVICWMFNEAIVYQKRNNYPVWPPYDSNILANYIVKKEQRKVVVNDQIACVFSVCYSDPLIWREMDGDPSVYLHRLVVNPNFKGQRNFEKVLKWTIAHAKQLKLRFIRMDTWANNPPLVDYYLSFGFKVVEYFTTPDVAELPIQQRKNEVVLLAMEI